MQEIELRNATVLVTGGMGFIGGNLILKLLQEVEPIRIVAVDNKSDYYDVAIKDWRLARIQKEAANHPGSSFELILGDVLVTYADTSALERDFGFKPATPLREGLHKFAKWHKNFYMAEKERRISILDKLELPSVSADGGLLCKKRIAFSATGTYNEIILKREGEFPMNYRFNREIEALQPSASIALMDKARSMKAAGVDVINLAGGEPDFDTPAAVTLTGIRGLTSGHTHYTAGRGIPALRKRIAQKLREENGIDCTADNILVTPGAKAAIYCAVRTLVNPGEEVLILDPSWVSYAPIVQAASGMPVNVPLTFETDYAITREALEANVSDKTRLLLLNTPNNPTGRVLTREEAEVVAEFAVSHDLMIVSDEVYEKIIFDGRSHISLGSMERIADRVVTVNGLSKSAAMTGWRLGYLSAPKEVVDRIYLFYQHVFTCLGEFIQEAAAVAFDCVDEIELMRRSYQTRRDSFIGALQQIPGVTCLVPEGAFYAWVEIDYQGMDASQLAAHLLDKAFVATVPGDAYAKNAKKCLRMCFAAAQEDLDKAAQRIAAALTVE